MGFSAWKGPILAFGRARPTLSPSGAGALDYNDNSPAPGLVGEYGWGMMDTRTPFAYQPDQSGRFYMHNVQGLLIDQVPSAISATNISGSHVPSVGVPITLVSSSGGGITVGASLVNSLTGAAVTGLLAIDTAMAPVDMGSAANMNGATWAAFWDPTKSIARNVRISSAGDDSGGTFTVRGYDLYWYPMTEVITGSAGSVASGVKAFKYIASITPAGTLSGSAITVGTGDVYGIPLFASGFGYVRILWVVSTTQTIITAITGFLAGDTTSPATGTTGDVRGTYAVQVASNGTYRMEMQWLPSVAAIQGGPSGIYGVQQYSG